MPGVRAADAGPLPRADGPTAQEWPEVCRNKRTFSRRITVDFCPSIEAGPQADPFPTVEAPRGEVLHAQDEVPEIGRRGRGEAAPAEGRLRTLIEQSPLAMHIFTPDGTSLLANAAWDELWDLGEDENSEGKNVFEDEQIRVSGLLPHIEEAVGGTAVASLPLLYEPRRAGRGGEPRWIRAFCYPVRGDDGQTREVSLIIEDVTERKNLEESLSHRAFHDDLTGLPNRALLMDRLAHALSRAGDTGRGGTPSGGIALLFMDLDNFKHVNDSLGHGAGDRLLVEVAMRLGSCVRPGDTVARLGGDEFVVLLEDFDGGEQATDVADRVAGELGPPFSLDGREVFVTASIGVVVISGDADADPQDILRSADVAMYRAKDGGKDRRVVFDPSMDGGSEKRLTLESGLRRALDRGEFGVVYQPVVRLSDGRCVGAEALVRWNHPQKGTVPPLRVRAARGRDGPDPGDRGAGARGGLRPG